MVDKPKRAKKGFPKPLIDKGDLVDVYYQGNVLKKGIYLGFGPESAISLMDNDDKVTIIRDWNIIRSSVKKDRTWVKKALEGEIY